MDVVSTALVATVGGAIVWVGRHARARQQDAELTRRLEAYAVDLPLDTRHLPPGLRSVAVGARVSRLSLETPLRRALETWDQFRPWQLRARLGDFDVAMADARGALWDWLRSIEALGTVEFELLRQLQLDPRPVRSLIYRAGVFDRAENPFDLPLVPVCPDVARVTEELLGAMEHLRRFEVELLGYRPRAYR